jgi:hypothetical protein
MIFKKYGTTLHSVDVDFDARAMNEIGFRRNREEEIPVADLDSAHTLVETRELTAEASGDVQDEAEQALLVKLEAALRAFEGELGGNEFLLIENDATDYPKTRDEKRSVVVDSGNRLHFNWRVDPPLRLGRYRRND